MFADEIEEKLTDLDALKQYLEKQMAYDLVQRVAFIPEEFAHELLGTSLKLIPAELDKAGY